MAAMKTMMKFCLSLVIVMLLVSACSDKSDKILKGVYFVCANDPDKERHFVGIDNRDAVEQDAQRAAKDYCENATGGAALNLVYVFFDGSQRSAN